MICIFVLLCDRTLTRMSWPSVCGSQAANGMRKGAGHRPQWDIPAKQLAPLTAASLRPAPLLRVSASGKVWADRFITSRTDYGSNGTGYRKADVGTVSGAWRLPSRAGRNRTQAGP